jgi:hypothetical protein
VKGTLARFVEKANARGDGLKQALQRCHGDNVSMGGRDITSSCEWRHELDDYAILCRRGSNRSGLQLYFWQQWCSFRCMATGRQHPTTSTSRCVNSCLGAISIPVLMTMLQFAKASCLSMRQSAQPTFGTIKQSLPRYIPRLLMPCHIVHHRDLLEDIGVFASGSNIFPAWNVCLHKVG